SPARSCAAAATRRPGRARSASARGTATPSASGSARAGRAPAPSPRLTRWKCARHHLPPRPSWSSLPASSATLALPFFCLLSTACTAVQNAELTWLYWPLVAVDGRGTELENVPSSIANDGLAARTSLSSYR